MSRASLAAAFALSTFLLAAPASAAGTETLYQRLGGYDAIAAVTDDFFARLGSDKVTKRFFAGTSASSLRRLRQLTVDFICEKSGGPCFYTGRSMLDAHKGIAIAEADWKQAGKLFGQTLDKFEVKGELRKEVMQFIGSLESDIVAGK